MLMLATTVDVEKLKNFDQLPQQLSGWAGFRFYILRTLRRRPKPNEQSNFLHLHITLLVQCECNLYAVKKPQMFIAEAQNIFLSIATIINFILIAELL